MIPLPQGYVDAARAFEKESGTTPGVDLASISDRMEIRAAVTAGDVDAAVEKVNDLNPEVSGERSYFVLSGGVGGLLVLPKEARN